MKIAVIAVAVVLGIIRPFLAPHPVSMQGSYEALAHLFVGGVIGAWMVARVRWLLANCNWLERSRQRGYRLNVLVRQSNRRPLTQRTMR